MSLSNPEFAPWSMALAAIHWAPGATPIVSSAATPAIVPTVWVPWPWLSTGKVGPLPRTSSQHSSAAAKFPLQRELKEIWLPSTPVSREPIKAPEPSMPSISQHSRARTAPTPGVVPIPRVSISEPSGKLRTSIGSINSGPKFGST